MGNRPTFIDIGPGRSGTSWLFENLSAHPAISMSSVKETEYFNTNFARGNDWYESHFPVGNIAIGEISNNYYLDAGAARRIAAYDPDMKIIVNARQPYSLLWSTYQFGIRRGHKLSGLEATLSEPIGRIMGSGYQQRQRAGAPTAADEMTLLDSILLERRLRPFFDAFPSRNVYILIYDRIDADPDALLSELYGFLGVDRDFRPTSARTVVNAAMEPRSRALARLASRTAFVLRRSGSHGLLGRLHRSAAIKRLLYRKPAARHESEAIRAMLSPATQRSIDEDMMRLLQSYPPLARWWPTVHDPRQTQAAIART